MCTGEVPLGETRPQSSQDGWDSGGPTSQVILTEGGGSSRILEHAGVLQSFIYNLLLPCFSLAAAIVLS